MLTPLGLQLKAYKARSAYDLAHDNKGFYHHQHIYRQESADSITTTISSMSSQSFSKIIENQKEEELLLRLKPTPAHLNATTTNAKNATNPWSKPNFGNDYSSAFVHSKILPQNYVQNIENTQLGYPRLQKLHELKREHTLACSLPPVSVRVPKESISSYIEELGNSTAQFDVVMVHGCLEPFPLEELKRLRIDKISSKPSLIFLWCSNEHIGSARQLLDKWGFRNAEDIAYLVSSNTSPHAPKPDSFSFIGNPSSKQALFKHTTWHCLMGLKGTLRRSTDIDLIHCNVNTDVIIEKAIPKMKQTNIVPNEIYELIENFTSMGRRIHIVPTESSEQLPIRPRPGWVVVAPDAFSVGDLVPDRYRSRIILPSLDEVEALRPRTPSKFK